MFHYVFHIFSSSLLSISFFLHLLGVFSIMVKTIKYNMTNSGLYIKKKEMGICNSSSKIVQVFHEGDQFGPFGFVSHGCMLVGLYNETVNIKGVWYFAKDVDAPMFLSLSLLLQICPTGIPQYGISVHAVVERIVGIQNSSLLPTPTRPSV
jgi:hypothetical protein